MKLASLSLKRMAAILVGLVVAVLLSLWQLLPRILHWQAEKFIAEKTGHRLVMDRPEFNPFQLALRLGKLQLSDPAGKPLFGFDGLLVDVSGASITKRALVFDAIRLDGPAATVVELPEGSLNWTPFLDALKGKDETSGEKAGLPRLDIRSFVLAGGKFDYVDRRPAAEGFATTVEPLDLELTDLSTLPDDEGKYRISARTTLGAQVELAGQVDLDPIMVAGTFSLADLQLGKLAPYLKNVLPVPPEGVLTLSARYKAGNDGKKFDAAAEQIQAKLTGLRLALREADGPVASADAIEFRDGRFQLAGQELALAGLAVTGGRLALPGIANPPQFGALTADDIKVALAGRHASVGKIRLAQGRVQVLRRADGSIDLQEAFRTAAGGRPASAEPAGPSQEAAAPWRYKVGLIEIADLGVTLQDGSVAPALELALDHIAAQVSDVSDDLSAPLPVKLGFDVRSGGRFESEGRVVPAAASADVRFRLNDLALRFVQPLLSDKTTLTLAAGRLSTSGRATYDKAGPKVKGEFAVRDLRLMEPGMDKPLLGWKTFGSRKVSLTEKALDLGELRLTGLDTRLLIDKDKQLNFSRVMKASGDDKPAAEESSAGSPAAVPMRANEAPTFFVDIDRLRFDQGEVDFADQSLILPFGTRIHALKGSIAGLSNRPGAVGQVELDGAVDEYGMARAVGQVELGNPTHGLDLRVQFRNVEMANLTPYTAHFAGRRIDSGKLSLDLQYKIQQRQLQGDNQVIMDKLTLGEKIESPTATNLPLDLAIALLQDSDGRIDLGLPVAGSLDDPQFSYGSLVWKAITNVLTKIVTAPFRALGALFGGGSEEIATIVFEAGAPQLSPPEREKLAKLAAALGRRPGLVLAVGGQHAEADRQALQDRQMRRTVLTQAGQRIAEEGDPGPLSTQQPKVRAALETLYEKRIGAADLAALKEGFRKANPGQLEEGMAGRLLSRLSGLMREKKTLSEDEVAQLKGADFYGLLFERLRAKESISDERLQALARQRGEEVADVLKASGLAAARLRPLPPAPFVPEAGGAIDEVPLRMELQPAQSH
ncbi:MAG: DUF748 domain-containing protein [Rhodocyclaceae bacterium]|jgi:hypothetical protein|nr:DUF748 domain-containing protein [Rhodocyclaceae bacterium]